MAQTKIRTKKVPNWLLKIQTTWFGHSGLVQDTEVVGTIDGRLDYVCDLVKMLTDGLVQISRFGCLSVIIGFCGFFFLFAISWDFFFFWQFRVKNHKKTQKMHEFFCGGLQWTTNKTNRQFAVWLTANRTRKATPPILSWYICQEPTTSAWHTHQLDSLGKL